MGYSFVASALNEISPDFRRIIDPICENARPCPTPVLLNIGGVPGSGKSTLVEKIQKHFSSFAAVRLDNIMQSHPGYLAENANSAQGAFANYEMPARAAGYCALREIIGKKADILFEYSPTTDYHLRFMIFAKRMGYRTVLLRTLVDAEIAKARIRLRQNIEGRHTPESLVDERLKAMAKMEGRYRKVVDFSRDIDNRENVTDARDAFSSELVQEIVTDIHRIRATPSQPANYRRLAGLAQG